MLLAGARAEEGIHHRHQHQHQHRRHRQPKSQRRGHRNQELCLEALLEQERQEAADRRDARQHHGPKPQASRLPQGKPQRMPLANPDVDEVDQADRVVHHHARQRDQPEHAEERQRHAHQSVAEHGSRTAERDGRHDQKRLKI